MRRRIRLEEAADEAKVLLKEGQVARRQAWHCVEMDTVRGQAQKTSFCEESCRLSSSSKEEQLCLGEHMSEWLGRRESENQMKLPT